MTDSYVEKNRERIKAQRRARYAVNAAPTLAQNKAYRKRNAAKINAKRRQRVYGTDGEALFVQQHGLCAICLSPMLRRHRHRRAAHLDHDHSTGRVRGWLCHQCNVGMGHFNDNVSLLLSAVKYLQHG